MVQARPIRVAIDAHVVGRRGTGNETYVVNLVDALMQRSDVDPIVLVDGDIDWPGTLPMAARREGADLLHVQYVAPPISGVPVVTAIHDVSFEDVPGLFRRPTEVRLKATVRWAARHSAAVVTISEFTKARLIHNYRLDPARIFVTPLAVAARWTPLDPEERARRLASRALPDAFVLAVGNLHPRKNIPRLIRAVADVRRTGPIDLGLVLVGQRGWRADEVDSAIAAVDGGSWIQTLGFVDDDVLQALYAEARVVAYPSLYEGFGLPVLEALACGAVVVASDTTAIPEAAGDAALLIDPTRDESVSDGILRACTDAALRSRLADAGPRHAARFTWDACAERTAAAYMAAVERR